VEKVRTKRNIGELETMKPFKPRIAEAQFLESRSKRREHQRAAYNLASIAHDRGNGAAVAPEKVKHYRDAHDLLREALSYEAWELTKSIEQEGDIHYNLACCLARLSECDGSVEARNLLTEVMGEARRRGAHR
jgi:hypothetical protein